MSIFTEALEIFQDQESYFRKINETREPGKVIRSQTLIIFVFSGFFGMRLVVEALKYACEKANIYPKIGVTIFRVWVIILAFVGIQLAWNMRPFLGNKEMPFELFRSSTKGNFYSSMLHAVGEMMGVDQNAQSKNNPSKPLQKEPIR